MLVFGDMEPDAVIEQLARRKGVYLVWRTGDLVADLSAVVRGREVSGALSADRIRREVCAVTDGLVRLGEAREEEARAKAVRPVTKPPAPSGPELIHVRARKVRFRRGDHHRPREAPKAERWTPAVMVSPPRPIKLGTPADSFRDESSPPGSTSQAS